jgi:hypothetical protein
MSHPPSTDRRTGFAYDHEGLLRNLSAILGNADWLDDVDIDILIEMAQDPTSFQALTELESGQPGMPPQHLMDAIRFDMCAVRSVCV